MRSLFNLFLLTVFIISGASGQTNEWPKAISSGTTNIKIYQPQIESYNGNMVKARGAFSMLEKGQTDPVFGALWVDALLLTNRDKRTAVLDQLKVTGIRFAGDSNAASVARMKAIMEKEIPAWDMTISLDELEASIENDGTKNDTGSATISTAPPKIIYANKPSTLVLIEGEPKLKENKEMGVEIVMNTPFTIVKVKNLYYLNGSQKWYSSSSITGEWTNVQTIPKELDKLNDAIIENDKKQSKQTTDSLAAITPEIIVSLEPSELIQTNGDADFAPIQGTQLLYVTNTGNDIFMNIPDQQYYILLSGRWYASLKLTGPWTYIASDKLPADFAKIPENSPKENVLASVAGTDQAQDAVMDAQIPQTAKVDRKTATAKVSYDGDPKFTAIDGTAIQYAVNTSSTVLLSNKIYYCVDNGIWFQSSSALGPWTVSTTRPADVSKIPASVPVYNVKYVYIYESTPQYVYVGYTPGYMGTYVYGGTVIYGTGYYYNPWYGPYYYPRPVTYGFSMHYNPYYGWGVGFHYSAGWFNYSVYGGGYHGGYWGPPMYRPPYYRPPGYPPYYRPPYYPKPGYRPPSTLPAYRGGNYNTTINNNIYRNNRGVSTNDRVRPMPVARPVTPATRPSTLPSSANRQPSTRPSTGTPVTTDRSGNVFQRDGNNWQQRENNGWQNVNQNRQSEINRLNQQQQSRDRGNMRTNNFNQNARPAPAVRPSAPQRTPSRGR